MNFMSKRQSLHCILTQQKQQQRRTLLNSCTYKYNYINNDNNNHSKKNGKDSRDFFVTSPYRSFHLLQNNNDNNANDKQALSLGKNSASSSISSSISSSSSSSATSGSLYPSFAFPNPMHITCTSFPSTSLVCIGTRFSKDFSTSIVVPNKDFTANLSLSPIHSLRFFSTTTPNSSSTPSPTNTNTNTNTNSKNEKQSKLKMIQKYGFTFLGCYFILWSTTITSFYIGLDTGLLDPLTLTQIDLPWHHGHEADQQQQDIADKQEFESAVDWVAHKMEQYTWTTPYADYVKGNPRISNLALAFIATKVTEPVRIMVILGIVPRVAKLIGVKKSEGDDGNG